MKNNYDLEVKKVLKNAEKEMFDLNHPYVGSEHMLLGILKNRGETTKILEKNGLTYENFRTNLIKIVGKAQKKSTIALYTPLLKRIISEAEEEVKESGDGKVQTEHLIISMLEEGEGIGIRILINMGINLEDIYNDLSKNLKPKKRNSDLLVYEIGKLMNGKNSADRIFKREKELNNLIEILLRKNKNNPLLLGEAGVGKTAIVEELARRIDEGETPDFLQGFKIVELDTGSLISGTRYRGDFEDRLNKIIKELINEKNIILFIDEIHTLVNCGGAEGAIDAANILKPYLARGDIKVIGATTFKEYKNSIAKDKALERRFQIINIEEPSLKDTEYILKNIKCNYEKHHNVLISDENIKDIIKYSDKYIFNRFNPDKSIDILDSVCAHVQLTRPNNKSALSVLEKKKEKFLAQKKYREVLEIELKIKDLEENTNKIQISRDDILKVIEYRANMPILDNFNIKLSTLEKTLKSHIYGQDEQIAEIAELLKEKYLIDNSKPLSILIAGPSGVGKTYTAKEIANNLFGNKHFLRLDMSEFNNEMSLTKLLGSSAGYVGYDDECLFNKIKDYPYSIVLLDEIEKASSKIQNLFLQILDEGFIRNSKGETICFNNVTIIMTCNSEMKSSIGFNTKNSEEKLLSNELLGRIDKTIYFSKIEKNSAQKYIKREMNNLNLSKEEVENIIKQAQIDKYGIRGIQKELNKCKIHKLLAKV